MLPVPPRRINNESLRRAPYLLNTLPSIPYEDEAENANQKDTNHWYNSIQN